MVKMYGTRWQYCRDCGETLDAGDNFGTDDTPLCVVCAAGRQLAELRRQGFTSAEITALQRVRVRETDRRYAELRERERRERRAENGGAE